VTRQRAPRLPEQYLDEGRRQQRVGAAGLVRSAAPVPEALRAIARAQGSLSSTSSAAQFAHDSWSLAAAGAQTKALSFLPITYSEHVYLNGLEQLEGTDWSRSGQTLSVLAPMDAQVGDALEVRYAYLAGLPSLPTDYGSDYVTAVMADAPLAYYRMDDAGTALVDYTGHGHNATGYVGTGLTRARPSLLPTDPNTATQITDAWSYFVVPSSSVFTNLTTAMSVEFWTGYNGSGTTDPVYYGATGGTYNPRWSVRVAAGNASLQVDGALAASGLFGFAPGNKVHVVMTYDGAHVVFYKNGTAVSSTAYTGSPTLAGPYELRIGSDGAGVGDLDEVAIYDHALSAARVAAHYAAG
jgi:hypothetical protein